MTKPIAPADLAEKMRRPSAPVLLDVRLEDDYAAAHLPSAKNNCVFEVAFLDRMPQLAPDKQVPVCVYGASAESHEARMAAEKLSRAGYLHVLELNEGLDGWRASGLPLEEKATARPPDSAPLDGALEIDLAESRAEWTGRNLLNQHHGQIALKRGKLHFDGNQLVGGELTLDMANITCQDLAGDPSHDVLIDHLKSDDFFDVELYPEARFVITSTEPATSATPGAPNLKVRGELTIKQTTRTVEFLASAGITPEGKAAAQAALTLDRTLWDVIYGSGKFFRNLGGHLVNDLIEMHLRIVTK